MAVRGSKIAALMSVFALRLDMLGPGRRNKKRGWHAQACACVRVVLLGRANKFSSDKQSHFKRGCLEGKKKRSYNAKQHRVPVLDTHIVSVYQDYLAIAFC